MKWVTCAAVVGLMSVGHSANADDKLTVYSYRQAFLVEPILTRFTEETGIGVNLVFAKMALPSVSPVKVVYPLQIWC